MARHYFGTDGVRGIVGEFVTAELVEKLGKASALWSGGGRVFVGRDTRASGVELEEAFARGVASAGGAAVLAGVVPDAGGGAAPARPRRRHLRVAQPAGVQRREVLRPRRTQAHRRRRGGDRGAARRARTRRRRDRPRRRRRRQLPRARARALRLRSHRPAHRRRLRERRVLGDRTARVRDARRRGGSDRQRARRDEHQRRLRRNRPRGAAALVTSGGFDLGVAFDGDGDRMLAVDGTARRSTATRSSQCSRSTSAWTSWPSRRWRTSASTG